jgi:hypothetical protein
MKIEFVRSGGFGGVRLSVNLDTQRLPGADASALEQMIRDSDFFNLPEQIKPASPAADRFEYSLSVSDGARSHSITVGETAAPEKLRPLLDRLTSLARSPR